MKIPFLQILNNRFRLKRDGFRWKLMFLYFNFWFSGKQTDLSVGFERAYEQFDMFERSRKVLDEMEKYNFEHERVIIFITDGRVQASEKQVKYEDTMKVS